MRSRFVLCLRLNFLEYGNNLGCQVSQHRYILWNRIQYFYKCKVQYYLSNELHHMLSNWFSNNVIFCNIAECIVLYIILAFVIKYQGTEFLASFQVILRKNKLIVWFACCFMCLSGGFVFFLSRKCLSINSIIE